MRVCEKEHTPKCQILISHALHVLRKGATPTKKETKTFCASKLSSRDIYDLTQGSI